MFLRRHVYVEVKGRQTLFLLLWLIWATSFTLEQVSYSVCLLIQQAQLLISSCCFSPASQAPYPFAVWQNATVTISNNYHLKRRVLIVLRMFFNQEYTCYRRWGPAYGGTSRYSVCLIFSCIGLLLGKLACLCQNEAKKWIEWPGLCWSDDKSAPWLIQSSQPKKNF